MKEDIYNSYLEGWNVKDLSYKFGLLPERVKAIVFDREYFWKHVYPIMGESGLNSRLEEEFDYARKNGYWKYGKDLDLMAEREEGTLLKQLSNGEIDARPTKEHEMKMSKALKEIKPKSNDHVKIGFYGKGGKKYMIKETIFRRGKGKKEFRKCLRILYLKDKLLIKSFQIRGIQTQNC